MFPSSSALLRRDVLGPVVGEAAERFGDATAYVSADGWPLTYRDLDRRSDEVAVGLGRRGVREGDVVALVLGAIPEYVVAYLAAAKLGAVTAGVNARLTPPERAGVLAVARPRLVLATPELAGGTGTDAEVLEVTPASSSASLLRTLRLEAESPPPLRPDPDRSVAIVFTSGTTGQPKGALFCGRQLEAVTSIDTGQRWGGGGASLSSTSLTHLGPMTKLAGSLHRGGTTHLVERWRAGEALRLVAEHRMGTVAGIPTQLALMLAEADFDEHDLSSVAAIVIGGGPATPALVREARERFAAPLAVRYSCTEAAIGTGTAFDDPEEDAELSVGRPQPGVTLSIVDDQAGPVEPGEVGEVCLHSAAVMSGYLGDERATAAAFTPDGAVRTGDLGWLDDADRLRLVGRSRELYVRGGYNVYPMEVEAVLAQHPAVADVAVVPRRDRVMGEVGVAVVVARDPAAPPALADLRAHAAPRLARHKLPEDILVTSRLPLTAMDKLDRRALATLVSGTPEP